MRSSVEIYDLATRRSSVVWQTEKLVEAPNWSRDGRELVINADGLIYRLPLVENPAPEKIDTGFATRCNNDHGLSPDGQWLAISDKVEHGKSCIYILPASGGVPRQVTPDLPSYWHGWSPDGARVCYCGIRDQVFDIYTIATNGTDERRLTHGEGRNDGPDWSADGQWIYFNSSRSGTMQIWRMHPDGTGVERLTQDGHGDWFAHPCPNNRKVVFMTYAADVFDHPRDLPVRMRMMDMDGGHVETLFELFGGQGSINVPSWSPDGAAFAYVRYFPAGN
ncbi:TolB family protein [Allorhizobium undicola]|uniref:TolB family protein n=1 Tax=Allorhizobium undicola TaxID=78527 RepID=UPI003D351DAD